VKTHEMLAAFPQDNTRQEVGWHVGSKLLVNCCQWHT